jgi:3-hydroxyisobutyrate dehydrogenase-like beta-hydroxyacid dehydrogenase
MKIAFLGTGLMGAGFVRRMLGRGLDVTVWNRSAAKTGPLVGAGAHAAADPAAAARGAERLFLSLSDDAAVDATLEAALPGLDPSAPIVDLTTTAPVPTRARGARLTAAGRPFLHAPVFMGPQNAANGEGLILCSGPEELFARLQPELAAMTGTVSYFGPDLGRAAAFKLFGNAMGISVVAALADVFAIARTVGVDLGEVVAFLSRLNPAAQITYRGTRMARGDYTATFELAMARKDVRLMIESAGGQPLAALPGIAARMDALIAAGLVESDLGVLARPASD